MTENCDHVWAWVREMYRGDFKKMVRAKNDIDSEKLISFDPHSDSFEKEAAEEVVVLEECRECGDRQVRQRATIISDSVGDDTAVEVTDYNKIQNGQ